MQSNSLMELGCVRAPPWGALEQVRDGVEGDAGGGGFEGGEHGGGGEGGEAVFVIDGVHGLGEAGALFAAVFGVEEGEGVEGVGDEVGENDGDEEGLLVFGILGARGPEFGEGVDEGGVVLALGDAEVCGPALGFGGAEGGAAGHFAVLDEGEGDADAGGPETFLAHAHGGFVEEFVGDGPGSVVGAELGGEDVLVAEGLGMHGFGHVEVFAAEPVPEAFSPDGAPELGGLFAVESEELGHGGDAFDVEAFFRACADAGQVAEGEGGEGIAEDVRGEGDEAVGFFHVGSDLGEVAVGSESDGAAEGGAGDVADGLFDAAAELHGGEQGAFASDEAAGHFVDGEDGGDGQAAFDGFDDAVVVLGIELMAGFNEDDVGAEGAGIVDEGAGFDAESLGLIAGGEADGGVGDHGDDGDGAVAELGSVLLLDGGKVGVEVDEEPVEAGDDGRGIRWSRGVQGGCHGCLAMIVFSL